jgi:hypothetical protein
MAMGADGSLRKEVALDLQRIPDELPSSLKAPRFRHKTVLLVPKDSAIRTNLCWSLLTSIVIFVIAKLVPLTVTTV